MGEVLRPHRYHPEIPLIDVKFACSMRTDAFLSRTDMEPLLIRASQLDVFVASLLTKPKRKEVIATKEAFSNASLAALVTSFVSSKENDWKERVAYFCALVDTINDRFGAVMKTLGKGYSK